MHKEYLIQVSQEGGKSLVRVLNEIARDQREGPSYATLAIALGDDETETILDAVREAFE
jgi:hypothetical protein